MNDVPGADTPGTDDSKRQAQEWATLIQRLVKALEAPHAGITHARKREGLSRSLLVRDPTADALRAKLTRLIESWGQVNAGVDVGDLRGTPESSDTSRSSRSSQVVIFRNGVQVAGPLTEQEIQALASYLQGLHARADDVAAAKAGK